MTKQKTALSEIYDRVLENYDSNGYSDNVEFIADHYEQDELLEEAVCLLDMAKDDGEEEVAEAQNLVTRCHDELSAMIRKAKTPKEVFLLLGPDSLRMILEKFVLSEELPRARQLAEEQLDRIIKHTV